MAITRRGIGLGLGAILLGTSRGAAQPAPAPQRIAAEATRLALLPAPAQPLEIYGFDGLLAGPELRVRQGETLRFTLANRLPEPLSLALPGWRARPPAPPVAPGAEASFELAAADAGTFWFRPRGFNQRARGLAGIIVVEERTPPAVDRDVVVVIKELFVDQSGRTADPTEADPSRLGLLLTIGGRPEALALTARPHERLRVRLVNASLGLVLPIAADMATLIARDGMPTEALAPNDLQLAPGNRADLVIDAGPLGASRQVAIALGGRTLPIVQTLAAGEPMRPAPLSAPAPLPANQASSQLELARARRTTLTFAGDTSLAIAGRAAGDTRPLFSARRGETLVFTFENRATAPLVVHVAGHHLRPLDGLDDGWKPWLLDTVLVEPGGRLLAACRAELAGSWPIEAHTAAPRPMRTEAVFAVG